MNRHLFRLVTLMLICMLLSTTAYADMGPKFSVEITVDGLEDRTCYATLISEQKSTGPYSAWDGSSDWEEYDYTGALRPETGEAFRAFAGLQRDGLYFLCNTMQVTDGSFCWGYYPPDSFRVALYFPDTKALVVGEPLERYAFESTFRTSLLPDGTLAPFEKTNPPVRQIPSFLLRVAATVLIELLIAGLFGNWDRLRVGLIVRTNLITQAGLNLGLALAAHSGGAYGFRFYAIFLLLEFCVFAVETAFYSARLKRPVLYAFTANVASFALGVLLAKLIPFSF